MAAKRIAAMSTKEEKEQFAAVRSDEGWLKEGVERRREQIFSRENRDFLKILCFERATLHLI